MASNLGDLFVKVGITGIPEFSAALNGVSGALSKAVSDADRSARGFDKMGSALTSLGTTLTAAITLPIAGLGIAATKMASDFDAGMRKVATVIGGDVTKEEMDNLSKSVLDLAKSMGIDAVNAARALQLAIGTGIPKENALEFLRVASVAAIGGVTDTSVVVDALTTVLAAYGLQAGSAKEVSDKMFEALRFGKGEFADLAASIGPVAAQAANMGISLNDLMTAVGTLSVTSGGMSEAVTQVTSVITGLNNATPQMEAALKSIGFQSGEAAVKALGLAGTLQALAEKTGGSTAAFSELLGRKEAVSAALGLTGIKVATVTDNMVAMTHALDGAGAAQRAFNIINDGTTRQFDALVNNLKTTAIELGQSLLPAVNQLLKASQPFVQFLADAAKWFGELPTPVKETAILFAAALAAVGPLIVGFGLLFNSVGSIISGFGAMAGATGAVTGAIANIVTAVSTNMVGALTSGELMLLRFGQAALLAGAAFAGWKFGEWLGNIKLVQDAFDFLAKSIPGAEHAILRLTGAYAPLKAAQEGTAFTIAMMEDRLSKHGVTVDKAGLSTDQYAEKLRAAVKVLISAAPAAEAVGKGLSATETATAKAAAAAIAAAAAHKKLEEALDAAQKKVTELKQAYDLHQASSEQVAKAEENVRQILLKLHPAWTAQAADMKLVEAALKSAQGALADTKQGYEHHIKTAQDVADAEDRVRRILLLLHPEWKAEDEAVRATIISNSQLEKGIDALGETLSQAVGAVNELSGVLPSLGIETSEAALEALKLSDAFKTIGITSPQDLKKTADAAEAAYEVIRSSSHKVTPQVEEAWQKMTQAQRDYAASIGDTETVKELDKLLAAHKAAGSGIQDIWQRTVQQVSTIISDMGKSFADGIFKLFDNSENNKFDEQAAGVRAALEDVTAEYTKHVADVSGELEAIPAAYSDALDTLKGVTDKKLGSLDKEYAKSIAKIQERFADITKAAQKQLDKQLADLDDQLSDKNRSYERSTEDAQDSYRRDTDNLKESLSDKERDYRQWVEGQQLKLRQLEGDNSSSAQRQRDAIQLELQHRAEDMEDTRQDIVAALAREESDLQQSLARKKQDWELEQQEIQQRQVEAQTAFQTTLTEAEGDLEASVLERKTTYEEDTANAIATYEASKIEIIKKFEDQTAALEAELTKSKGAYDTYKTDIEAKLKEIEDAHKGPLERIGELFKGVFTSAGEALLRFAGEQVMGALFKQFDKLIEMIPGIGSALGGIFGGIGGSAGTIATPPITTTSGIPGIGGAGSAGGSAGSAGSGVGGALGSISAVTGIVTGIVSAVTDVMGVFRQMQMDTALNKIEQHTAVIAYAIAGIGEPWATAAQDSDNLLTAVKRGGLASKGLEDSFSGWFKETIGGMWDNVWDIWTLSESIDKNLGYLYELASQSLFDMQVKLGDIRTNTAPMAQTAGPSGGVTVIVQGNFYGNDEAARQLTQLIGAELRLQGVGAA